jgi:hypothetical protein
VISASTHADLWVIPHESALFSIPYKLTSLWSHPISGHCEGVCTPDTMVCALVRGSTRDGRRRRHGQKPLICMYFHGVFLGSQHAIWSKQHNRKVSRYCWSTYFKVLGVLFLREAFSTFLPSMKGMSDTQILALVG